MKVPIQMENIAMGIALYLAGIPLWREESFAFVIYDKPTLNSLGCKTIREALEKRLCGKRVCNFSSAARDQVDYLKDIWDDERDRISKGLTSEVEVSPEDMVRIAARVQHCRKQMTQDWPDLPILALESRGVISENPEEGVTVHGGFRMFSIRAAKETLARLGVIEGKAADEEEDEA